MIQQRLEALGLAGVAGDHYAPQDIHDCPRPQGFLAPPFWENLETAVRCGFSAMLFGPRGTGKTTAVKEIARQRGKRLFHIQGHADLMIEELRGTVGLEKGSTLFKPGTVTRAVQHKAWLLFDELNLCRPAVTAWLNNIIDKEGTLSIPETGEVISVPGDFLAFFCFNEGYQGTRELNEALKDRCWPVLCEYWPEELEFSLLKNELPDIADVDARRAIEVANAVRKARKEGGLDFDFSIRTLVHWVSDAYERTADLLRSFRDVVLAKVGDPLLNAPQQQAMKEIAHLILE